MLKKVIIIIAVILVVLCGAGYYGINFVFERFIFKPSIASLQSDQPAELSTPAPSQSEEANTVAKPEATPGAGSAAKDSGTQAPNTNKGTGNSSADNLYEVVKSPSMSGKLESEIGIADKARILAIILSCFSPSEVQRFYSMASDGISPQERDEMMSLARKRFTSQQKQELKDIYRKYIDKISRYKNDR